MDNLHARWTPTALNVTVQRPADERCADQAVPVSICRDYDVIADGQVVGRIMMFVFLLVGFPLLSLSLSPSLLEPLALPRLALARAEAISLSKSSIALSPISLDVPTQRRTWSCSLRFRVLQVSPLGPWDDISLRSPSRRRR